MFSDLMKMVKIIIEEEEMKDQKVNVKKYCTCSNTVMPCCIYVSNNLKASILPPGRHNSWQLPGNIVNTPLCHLISCVDLAPTESDKEKNIWLKKEIREYSNRWYHLFCNLLLWVLKETSSTPTPPIPPLPASSWCIPTELMVPWRLRHPPVGHCDTPTRTIWHCNDSPHVMLWPCDPTSAIRLDSGFFVQGVFVGA
jgi:hypothetical protein